MPHNKPVTHTTQSTDRSPDSLPGPGQAPPRKKVFIVDDHPIVRNGLVQLINGEPDLTVVGQGEDVYGSLQLIRQARPDLCLVDVSLGGGDGLELLKELQSWDAALPVLMLSMHDESLYAERALRAGARGYVMKQQAPQTLLAAVRRVLEGQVYVSERIGATLLQRMVGGKAGRAAGRFAAGDLPMDRLTDREMEVFRMIGEGDAVKSIADKLCISPKTVEAHREHIKEKLGLRSSAELLRFAIRNAPVA